MHVGSIPRWAAVPLALLIWLLLIPAVHGALPWFVSTLAPRYGWRDGYPSFWNLLGLFPIAVGVGLLSWVLYEGIRALPKRVELGSTSSFLLKRGPYSRTRNPMYVAEMALWLGWASLFGSIPVLLGFLIGCIVLHFVVLPFEESRLETRFGPIYGEYRDRVPRWLGRARESAVLNRQSPAS